MRPPSQQFMFSFKPWNSNWFQGNTTAESEISFFSSYYYRYDYRSGRYRYDEEPVFNARIVREEFPFCDCSYQCDACTGKDSRDPNWNEYEYECDACSLCKFPPNILIFGDFFNVNSIPQENRHRKCDLKDWILL